MTYLEAYKEAARRSGDSDEVVEALFKSMRVQGVLTDHTDDVVPPGTEEAVIAENLASCLEMKGNTAARAAVIKAGEPSLQKRRAKN